MGVNESEGLGNLQLKLTQSAITNVSIFSFFEITVFSLGVSGACYTASEATLPRFPVAAIPLGYSNSFPGHQILMHIVS